MCHKKKDQLDDAIKGNKNKPFHIKTQQYSHLYI